MNNTFSFSRLTKLLAIDIKRMESKYGLSILVFAAGHLVYWIATSLFGITISGGGRHLLIYIFLWFCVFIAPSKIYGYANDKLRGISFATLPASSLEKSISMAIVCLILVPLQAYICLVGTDTILSLLPFGSFEQNLFEGDAPIKFLSAPEFGHIKGSDSFPFFVFIQLISNASFAMFGALLFKKHKVTKSILVLIAGYIVISRIYVWVLRWCGVTIAPNDIQAFIEHFLVYIQVLVYATLAGSLYGVYHRVKTFKY